jgi:hypothetical protein
MTESMQVRLRTSFTPYMVEIKTSFHQHRKRSGKAEDARECDHA